MKRESVIAILLGVVAGVTIALFIIFHNNQSSSRQADESLRLAAVTPAVKIKQKQNDSFTFSIESPLDKTTISGKEIVITGKALKNSLIVAQSQYDDATIKTTDGPFSLTLDAKPGENFITLTEYAGATVETKQLTIYSNETQ